MVVLTGVGLGGQESNFNQDAFKPTRGVASDPGAYKKLGGCNNKAGWYGPAKGQCSRDKTGGKGKGIRSQEVSSRRASRSSQLAALKQKEGKAQKIYEMDPSILSTVDKGKGGYGKERVSSRLPGEAKKAAKPVSARTAARRAKAAELRAQLEKQPAAKGSTAKKIYEMDPSILSTVDKSKGGYGKERVSSRLPGEAAKPAATKRASKKASAAAPAASKASSKPAWAGLDAGRAARLEKLMAARR
jgi:hypothetical protein